MNKKNAYKIDFVILWVDGSDEKWLEEKKKYKPDLDVANSIIRFRDWENLKYWFRGVEKFAPWVNNIYFVTYGHLPEFLNTEHEKLIIINHKDIMQKEYLPTYNSNVIDLNLHNIKGLKEHFVYFNDDTFIIDKVKPEDFFKNGLPVEEYAEIPVIPHKTIYPYSMFNNAFIINKHYNKKQVYKKYFYKLYNLKYGINNIRTLLVAPYLRFTGFYSSHLPISFLKSYYDKLWKLEYEECDKTSKNKFRTKEDITSYLIKEMQMLDGNFYPRKKSFGNYYIISNDNSKITRAIAKQKYKMVCINDQDESVDFDKCKKEINNSFEKILPNKSSFEK